MSSEISETTQTDSGKKLSSVEQRTERKKRDAEVMKNSQPIKNFFSKTHVNTRTGLARDVSLGNNTNEADDVSDDLSREKEIQLPPKPPFSSPPKTPKQKSNSKSDDSFNDEFGETDQDRYFYDSEYPDNTFLLVCLNLLYHCYITTY